MFRIFLCLAFLASILAPSAERASAFDIPPEEWEEWENPQPAPKPTPAPGAAAEEPPPAPAKPPVAGSTSEPERHPSGTVVLPTSGLRIDLQPVTGVTYKLTGRWGYDANDITVTWARDTIDEVKDKKLVGATWYHVGPFKAGACAEVLKSIEISDAFTESMVLHGMNVEVRAGTYLFQSSLGARPVAVVCGGDPKNPLLVFRFFFEPGAPTALPRQTLLDGLRAASVVREIVTGHAAERWSRVRPLNAKNVSTQDLARRPNSFRLGIFNGTLAIPDDGALWTYAKESDADGFARRVPRFPDLSLRFIKGRNVTCDKGFQNIRSAEEQKGRRSVATLPPPAGWRAGSTFPIGGGRAFTALCRSTRQGVAFVEVQHASSLGDLSDAEGMLGAFVKAVDGAAPTPASNVSRTPTPARPVKPAPSRPSPPRPAPSRRIWRDEMGTMTSFDFVLAISHRDSVAIGLPESAFPSLRVAGPGLSINSLLFETDGGLLLRTSVGVLPDFMAALDDALVSTSRHGGQMWEAAAELGLGLAVGGDDILGLTLGWHGLSGPLLLNSSLAASLHWLHMPEDPGGFGWTLRVTPAQFVPANERMFLSPLSIDWRMAVDGFSFGLELQWVGAPKASEDDIPAEGMAAIVRFGAGAFSF